jgi:hypothetical protein
MASQNINQLGFAGSVYDPTVTVNPDGSFPSIATGHQSEQNVGDAHGKVYIANYRNKTFEAAVVNITVPVIANNLASVFALINPPNSGVNAELIDTTVSQWMVTAVVDTVGWYYSPVTKLFAGTFTTLVTPNNGTLGNAPPNKVLFYSAYTHSGTPSLIDAVGSFGAAGNVSPSVVTKFYDGRLILPPGNVMSIAMSTAAGTATGLNVEARWMEWPV